jgi:hypothetical protein
LTDIQHEGVAPIVHPAFLIRDVQADQFTFDHVFGGLDARKSGTLSGRLAEKAKAVKRRIMRLTLPR